ncbi:glycoside hydrolase family 127 protein [Chitinophaga oryziterrae]|uniref:Glycoside hydrolase family 127 protein n=1 Tax=Chitinophaga oryziterrae TaxID=1031224 RepID=A0A6N8JB00_9BACT|nr:glycoside hydrolase family 127 protein [Chitinophaga oryziterrae]MVT41648.1 glycoside hydrolase family 127 protein [Chitinophaga oryziterrae]
MKKILLLLGVCVATTTLGQVKDYPFKAVSFTAVRVTDSFWLPRLRINHMVTIPASFERCESTGRVRNFEMAAAHSGKFCTTFPFDDTDIYKTIEGASFSLSLFPDKKLSAYIDSLIIKIGKAQEPDGYLYTARTINPASPHEWAGTERWIKERELSHELYNAGHLYEAAFAHYYATGKRSLLDIALKNADLVCSVFGPDKKHVAPGHEIVEMGLVKLYRITGKKEYLETAKFFISERGHYMGYDTNSKDPWKSGAYWQDNKPVTEQYEAEGHAVRAGYLYAAMADVAALTGDEGLLHAIDTIWMNMVSKKMYVQGGLGAVPSGERFGDNYELPNATAYNETCASIASVYWNYRMFLLHGDSKYMDILEKTLYNGLISGLGLDGKSFFYSNAMEIKNSFSHKNLEPERSGWFDCSCCPTNLTRLIPSIPGYVYAQKDDNIYVNLFIASNATLTLQNRAVNIEQQNSYPWDGDLVFKISPEKTPAAFNLLIRIPGWAQNEAVPLDLYKFTTSSDKKPVIKVNGQPVEYEMKKGYASLTRTWKKNDRVEVLLPMEVRKIKANEMIKDDIGKVALQRGPVIYCGEWVDNNGKTSNIIIPYDAVFTSAYEPGMLNGVEVINSNVPVVVIDESGQTVSTVQRKFTAIPYYAWANRGKGEMMVWFPGKINDIDLLTDRPVSNTISK